MISGKRSRNAFVGPLVSSFLTFPFFFSASLVLCVSLRVSASTDKLDQGSASSKSLPTIKSFGSKEGSEFNDEDFEDEQGDEQKLFGLLPLIHPDIPARRWWDVFMTFLILFTVIDTPWILAYRLPLISKTVTDMVDVFFGIDICLQFMTGFEEEDSTGVIMDPGKIVSGERVPPSFVRLQCAAIAHHLLAGPQLHLFVVPR